MIKEPQKANKLLLLAHTIFYLSLLQDANTNNITNRDKNIIISLHPDFTLLKKLSFSPYFSKIINRYFFSSLKKSIIV